MEEELVAWEKIIISKIITNILTVSSLKSPVNRKNERKEMKRNSWNFLIDLNNTLNYSISYLFRTTLTRMSEGEKERKSVILFPLLAKFEINRRLFFRENV